MQSPLSFIARSLLAVLFLVSGVRKILAFSAVSGMMAGKGFPMPDVVLASTIALEIGGALMLIANWNARPAALALAAFTLAAGVIFHGFWSVPAQAFSNDLNHFLKNLAVVGGLLLVAQSPAADRTSA